MALPIALGVPTSGNLSSQLEFIERAESLGFAGAGVADHLRYGQDVFMTLGAAASRTTRIELYPAVTNPVVRSPAVLAGHANSLAQLAPGRSRLAIGAGDQSAIEAGVRPAKLAQFRDAVVNIKRLLDGEEVIFDPAPPLRLENLSDPAPPVVVTASGPRTIAMGAEVADELLLFVGVEPAIVKAAMEYVELGAKLGGRHAADIPITHYVFTSIDDDEVAAFERTRYWLNIWLQQGLLRIGCATQGIDPPASTDPSYLTHAELRKLASLFFIVGTPETAVAQLQTLWAAGAQQVFCMLPGAEKSHKAGMEVIASRMLPAFA